MHNAPKKLYQAKGKDGTYEFLGHSTGAGTSRGHDVESYRDIHTGRLFHRLPDDFENRMHCIGERVEFPYSDAAELQQWRELFEVAMATSDPYSASDVGIWPNSWEGDVAILAYQIKTLRETIDALRGGAPVEGAEA